MSGMDIQSSSSQQALRRTALQAQYEQPQGIEGRGERKPLEVKGLETFQHPLDRITEGADGEAEVLKRLKENPALSQADDLMLSAAASVLCQNLSPALIMQQLESIYREQAMASKQMSAELSVEVAKIRTEVRQDQIDASKKQLDAAKEKALIGLGTGIGGSVMGIGGGVLGARSGGLSSLGSGLSSMGEVMGRQGEGIGELATVNQNRAAALQKTNADFMKSIGDEFSKKTDQMEQNAQELRRKAAEAIQNAVSLNAQAQQSVNLKL